MTKVTNQNGTFWIPDEIANDPTKTVAELLEVAIPYEEYEKQQQLELLQNELAEINITDEELLEWAKDNHPEYQHKKELEKQISNLE